MGRVADLLGAVAAAAEEGPEGLALAAEDRAVLLEGWSDDDVDDALGLVRDSLLLGELVEAAGVVSGRLMSLLGRMAEDEAFEELQRGKARLPTEQIAHLARGLERLEEILEVYRDEPPPPREGFDRLRRRLADLGIEEQMRGDGGDEGEPS